jgi:hypothetical protein
VECEINVTTWEDARDSNRNKKFQIGIVALQEIHWTGQGRIDKHDYTPIYSGSGKRTGQLGMGFTTAKAIRQNIIQIETINTRISKVRIKVWFRNITIISAHAPTKDKGEFKHKNFYDTLEEICHQTQKYDMLTVMDDFNVKYVKRHLRNKWLECTQYMRAVMRMEGCWGSLQLKIICLLKYSLPSQTYTSGNMEDTWDQRRS